MSENGQITTPPGRAALRDTVSAQLVRFLVDATRAAGASPGCFTGLPDLADEVLADDLVRVPTSSATVVWEVLTALRHAEGGLATELVRRSPLGTFGVWDYLFVSGVTVADGLRDGFRYRDVICDADSELLELRSDGALLTVRHRTRVAEPAVMAAVGEYALAMVLTRCREAARQHLVPVHVGFAHPLSGPRGELADLFDTSRIDFGCEANTVTFLATDLTAPRADVRPGLSEVLRAHAEMLGTAAKPVPDWYAVFRSALTAALFEGAPTIGRVAGQLHLSPRTVQRRLDELGTTWRAEVDCARADHAARLLGDARLPLRAVASRIGYRDERSLRRALRRWAG